MSRDALIVGVNTYHDSRMPALFSPADDAEKVYNLLCEYGEFDTIKPLPLVNSDNEEGSGFTVGKNVPVYYSDLENALIELFMPSGRRTPDMALFYFSGHGQRKTRGIGESFLAVSDSQIEGGNMGVSLKWLREILAQSQVRNQVILLDCCYSGELLDFNEADPATGGGRNRCFVAASREYQAAYEQGSGKHGILTDALLKALNPNTSASGLVHNESLTARVRELCKPTGIQAPLCLNSGGEQIVITRLPVKAVATKIRQQVCMISSEYPPHVHGGLGVHVTKLTERLADFVDLDIVLPHKKKDYMAPPVGIRTRALAQAEANYEDPLSWLHFSRHAFELIKENISPKPTVIHCHDWVTVICGIKCRWTLKIPLVYHIHLPNRSPFCSSVENLGLVCADIVTANSQAMREQLNNRFPDKRIKIIPNGVDMETFKPGKPDKEVQYVLFVGRLVEQKGLDHLLRAFVHVRSRFPSVMLKIVGEGPCRTGYEQLADCLLIKDNVKFLGWTESGLELNRLYQNASVVVIPSVYEPFGMTALEAMACARPVVASNTGGLAEIIKHGATGYLAEPKDHLDLAQWIIRLLDRGDLQQELGDRAGQHVRNAKTYQWASIAGQFDSIYREIAGQELNLEVPAQAEDYVHQIRSFTNDSVHIQFLENLFV